MPSVSVMPSVSPLLLGSPMESPSPWESMWAVLRSVSALALVSMSLWESP